MALCCENTFPAVRLSVAPGAPSAFGTIEMFGSLDPTGRIGLAYYIIILLRVPRPTMQITRKSHADSISVGRVLIESTRQINKDTLNRWPSVVRIPFRRRG